MGFLGGKVSILPLLLGEGINLDCVVMFWGFFPPLALSSTCIFSDAFIMEYLKFVLMTSPRMQSEVLRIWTLMCLFPH